MSDDNDKLPFRVGLTGGIASGKTTISNIFLELGVPVIDTDVIAREVVKPGEPALAEIQRAFGDRVIDATGHLDRGALRRLIFGDESARKSLEAILHPLIGAEVIRLSQELDGPYQVIVVPLLVGSPLREFVNRILVVDCNEDLQLQRLMARDADSIEQARKILSAQASRESRLSIADDVVQNEQGLAEIRDRVTELDGKYRRLAHA